MTGGGLTGTAPSWQSPGALSPEHAHGFSSLALLAGRERHTRILYLLTWSSATVATMCPDEARSSTIGVDGWSRLPLAAESVDAVVADLDIVPDAEEIRQTVATELGRVLKSGGRCIATITHRRRPRDPRELSRYRLVPPLTRWRVALSSAGLAQLDAALLFFDGPRITRVQLPPEPCREGVPGEAADAVALIFSRMSPDGSSVLDEISRSLGPEVGAEHAIDRIHVRKIGKTAAFLSAGRSRIVVRMPCSPVALARARRNHAALEALHGAGAGAGVSLQVVPEPLARGEVAGTSYFVETCVPGAPRETRVTGIRWEPEALEFITHLHAATARRQVLSDAWFEQAVEPALSNLEQCDLDGEERAAIAWLRSTLRDCLVRQQLPLVRSHGDFTGSNCLYNTGGRLSGVVDWELSSGNALPLLDLVQCVDLPVEYTRDGRWQRAELVFDAVERTGPLFAAPEIVAYTRRLDLPERLVPPLLLVYWVDHAGARILARKSDARWFHRRVKAPLRRLRQLVERSAY